MVRFALDWESVFVFVFSIGVYLNTLDHGFVYDDNRAVLANPDVLSSSPLVDVFRHDFWGTPLSSRSSHGSYRPLCVLSFRLNQWAAGLRPLGYHLTNVVLHGAAAVLVLRLGRVLLPGSALLGAAVFAAHPVHSEAVAGVVGRADVLSCVFLLTSFLCYAKHVTVRDLKTHTSARPTKKHLPKRNPLYSFYLSVFPQEEKTLFALYLAFAVCAMLSKEPGISAIPLAVSYDIILHLRSRRNLRLGSAVITSTSASVFWFFVILSLRLYIMGLQTPDFSKADNPTARDSSILTRTLTFLYLPFFNFLLLIFPRSLSFDWSMDAIPRISSVLDFRVLLTAAFYSCLYCTTIYALKSNKTKSNKLANQNCKVCKKDSGLNHIYNCKILNNNNLPVKCNCLKNLSVRFSPETTVPMCLAFLVIPFIPASNLFFYVGFVVAERVLYTCSVGFCLLVALGAHLLWFKSRAVALVGSLVLVTSLTARTLQRNGDWKDEESLYRSALHINPPKAYGNLGSVLSTAGRLEEAEVALRMALSHRPNMADVHYNLGNLFTRQDKYEEAEDSYRRSIQYRPSLAVAYLNLGHVMEVQENWGEAESVYVKCSELAVSGLKDPKSHEDARASCLLRLKQLCRSQNCSSEASHLIKQEIVCKSSVNQGSGSNANGFEGLKMTANNTSSSDAEEVYLRAVRKNVNDPAVHLGYGQFLVQQGRLGEAADQFVRAAGLAPHQHTLVTSAAIALRQAGRLAEAEVMYRTAREIRPMDATSHSNLGAILHLQGKYRPAAASYREALRLAPTDRVTLTNLRRLRNILSRNNR